MDLSEYRELTQYEEWVLHEELGELIERTDPGELPTRPKQWRK